MIISMNNSFLLFLTQFLPIERLGLGLGLGLGFIILLYMLMNFCKRQQRNIDSIYFWHEHDISMDIANGKACKQHANSMQSVQMIRVE